jgi:hypothetical protein
MEEQREREKRERERQRQQERHRWVCQTCALRMYDQLHTGAGLDVHVEEADLQKSKSDLGGSRETGKPTGE